MSLKARPGVKPGPKVKLRTWFGLWMEMNKFRTWELAKILMVSGDSIVRWRRGGVIGPHFANLLRAFYPDCPVSLLGGPVNKLSDPLPVNARTNRIYRYLFKMAGFLPKEQIIWPIALETARRCGPRPPPSEPGQGSVLPGHPNP